MSSKFEPQKGSQILAYVVSCSISHRIIGVPVFDLYMTGVGRCLIDVVDVAFVGNDIPIFGSCSIRRFTNPCMICHRKTRKKQPEAGTPTGSTAIWSSVHQVFQKMSREVN